MRKIQAVILAAGRGSRLQSEDPKILQKIDGKTIAEYVIDLFKAIGIEDPIFVVGYRKEIIIDLVRKISPRVRFAHQEVLSGTATAFAQALPQLQVSIPTVVMMGDHPFYQPDTIKGLVKAHYKTEAVFSMTSHTLQDASGHARILRDSSGRIYGFQETRESEQLGKTAAEVNLGCFVIDPSWAMSVLECIQPSGKNNEYYLTSLVDQAYKQNKAVTTFHVERYLEAIGINNPDHLEKARNAHRLLGS